ncbi:hypothetical protein OJAV_G00134200 [Oryzias javanicus]|uniref:Uncharacterized protein n=1 Tax=Oryzias javanicus TaxID=123683 RepID=A0A3S2PZ80_ORYJA|nr:hypothetical protein OJAV_G00134200 [Oryzias javanicus]
MVLKKILKVLKNARRFHYKRFENEPDSFREEEREEEPVRPSEAQNVPAKESQKEDLILFNNISSTQQHENKEDISVATFPSQIQAWEDEKLENEHQDDFLMKLLSQENTNLEKEIERVKESVEQFEFLQHQSKNDSSKLQLLKQRNAALRAELQTLQRKCEEEAEFKLQNQVLQNDLKSEMEEGLTLENELCELKLQYSQALMEKSKTESEQNALQKTNLDLQEKRDSLRDMIVQLEELEARVLDLKIENDETIQEIKKLQDKLLNLLEFKTQILTARDERKAAQDQNSQLKEQLSKLDLLIQQEETLLKTTMDVSAQVSPPTSKIQPKKPVLNKPQCPAGRHPGVKPKAGLEGKVASTYAGKTDGAKAAIVKDAPMMALRPPADPFGTNPFGFRNRLLEGGVANVP